MPVGDNPFRPGLGLDPPVLAGREAALAAADEVLDALEALEGTGPLVFAGLVGMGRTATLGELARRLAPRRWAVGAASVQPDRFGVTLGEAAAAAAASLAARRPGGVAAAELRAAAERYRTELDGGPAPGSGEPTTGVAVRRLLRAAGTAATEAGWGICLLLDDLHQATGSQLSALAEAACDVADRGWAVAVVGAGLPSIDDRLDRRLVRVVALGPLDLAALTGAVATPLGGVGRGIDAAAVDAIARLSGGCPLLVQAYAAAAWDEAVGGPVGLAHVAAGRRRAEQDLERWFFAGSLVGLAPHEQRYLRAMAELGDVGVPADALARRLGDNGRPGGVGSRVAGVRARLEQLGLIHSVGGDRLDFSLPLLGGYLRSRS